MGDAPVCERVFASYSILLSIIPNWIEFKVEQLANRILPYLCFSEPTLHTSHKFVWCFSSSSSWRCWHSESHRILHLLYGTPLNSRRTLTFVGWIHLNFKWVLMIAETRMPRHAIIHTDSMLRGIRFFAFKMKRKFHFVCPARGLWSTETPIDDRWLQSLDAIPKIRNDKKSNK